MIAKDFLRMVYPLINQKGWSVVVWNNWIPILNSALNIFFNYKGYRWLWETCIQEVPVAQLTGTNLEFATQFPVIGVHKWFLLPKEACTDNITMNGCQTTLVEMKTWQATCCELNCGTQCEEELLHMSCGADEKTGEIPMKFKLPKSPLFCGEFQQPFGTRSKYIRAKLPANFDGNYKVYIEYFRGFNMLTSYNDVIPIPDNMMTALSFILASLVINPMWQFRSGDSKYYKTLFQEEMDNCRDQQTVMPKEIEMSWF